MDDITDRVSAAWRRAGEDLGIRVEAPFRLTAPSGETTTFIAYVACFGAHNGTLVSTADEWSRFRDLAAHGDYYISGLNPERYSSYDRQTWIDTLHDWSWTGGGEPPSWYTGISPWYSKLSASQELARELERIFGRKVPATEPRQLSLLPFVAEDELLVFLRSVPAGVTIPEFTRRGIVFSQSRRATS